MIIHTALSIALLLLTTRAHGQSEDLHELTLPAGFSPTSSVTIAASTTGLADVFYRGSNYELLHLKMQVDGTIVTQNNLGGILLTAPAATSPFAGALDVAYVTTEQRVVIRSFRNGIWGLPRQVGTRSEHAPAILSLSANQVSVFITRVNRKVFRRTRNGNNWGPFENLGISAMGSPAVAASGGSGLAPQLFVRNVNNKVMFRPVSGNSAWSAVPGPKYYSDLCAMYFVEDILAVFGRNSASGLSITSRIGSWSTSALTTPWISDAPGCFFAFDACSDIIIKQRGTLYRRRFCS